LLAFFGSFPAARSSAAFFSAAASLSFSLRALASAISLSSASVFGVLVWV